MSKFLKRKLFFFVSIIGISILTYLLRNVEIYKNFVSLNFLYNYRIVKYKTDRKKIKVRISGMIKNAGVYEISQGSRLKDLILIAGGLRKYAYKKLPYKIILKDSEEYYIPFRKLKKGETVNINTADKLELCTIPYISKMRAESIIKYREKYGRFDEKEEIMEIEGIGKKRYNLIKNFIDIGE